MASRLISVLKITGGDRTWVASYLRRLTPGHNWVVSDLKAYLEEETDIPISEQLLVMKNDTQTRLLDDPNELVGTLHPWREGPLSITLYTKVKPRPRALSLYVSNTTVPINIVIEIESTASVEELKRKIDEVKGIPPYRQQLFAVLSKPTTPLYVPMLNTYQLEDVLPGRTEQRIHLGILPREMNTTLSPVRVVPALSAPAVLSEVTFYLDLERDTVHTLMGQIRVSTNIWNYPGREFFLRTGNGVLLADGASTLKRSGVNANDKLYVVPG